MMDIELKKVGHIMVEFINHLQYVCTSWLRQHRGDGSSPKNISPFLGNVAYSQHEKFIDPPDYDDPEDVKRFNKELDVECDLIKIELHKIQDGKRGWLFGP